MTRGKYAARAAKDRAETAGARADRAASALTEERQRHAAEVAELKAQVQQLSTQLVGAVSDLAAQEVQRVRGECAAQIVALRAEQRQAALEVFRRISRATVLHPGLNEYHLSAKAIDELVPELAKLLGVPVGEARDAGAEVMGENTTRAQRRADAKRDMMVRTGTPRFVVRDR